LLDDGQHYYFNTITKDSHWTVPEEVEALLEAGEGAGEKRKEEGQDSDGERDSKKQKTEDE
jgi:hypothetical protein